MTRGQPLQCPRLPTLAEDGQHRVARRMPRERPDQQIDPLAAMQPGDGADEHLVVGQLELLAQARPSRRFAQRLGLIRSRRPVVDHARRAEVVAERVPLRLVDADQAVEPLVVMGLVADMQRAEAQRRVAARDGLAGGAEVAVAKVRAQPAQQRIQPGAAPQRERQHMVVDARRHGATQRRAAAGDHVDAVAGRGLRGGEVERMPFRAGQAGREDDMDDGQRRE